MFDTKFYRHPNWYQENFADIAILKLEEKLEFNEFVKPIRLANLRNEGGISVLNDCKVAGFGNITSPQKQLPWMLQEAPTNLISRGYCRRLNSFYAPHLRVTRTHICTKDSGYGACYGDGGSPLVCFDAKKMPYQVGIISWGSLDCWEGFNVYTRVARFRRWIRENMEQSEEF
ncbi:CLIP domain-containing serine protease [Mactra antiquata]